MISTRSGDHGRPATKHGLYQRKRQPFAARNQDMDMMVSPYLHEVALITAKPYAIFQPKVSDDVLYVSCVRPAAKKIESPIASFPLRSGEGFKNAILAFTEYVISDNCRKSHFF